MYTIDDFYTIFTIISPLLMFVVFFDNSKNVNDVCVFIFLMAIIILSYDAYMETLNYNKVNNYNKIN